MIDTSAPKNPLFALEAAMSAQDWERIKAAEAAASTYIRTERDSLLEERIAGLLRHVLIRRDSSQALARGNRARGRALVVVGRSGAGKTRTIEKAVMAHEALRPIDGDYPQRPLISITAPETPSPRSLYIRLLSATGYPLVHAPSTEMVLERFKAQARRLGTLLVHIDDAANMLTGVDAFRRRRAAEKMATSLRALMEDDDPLSVIVSGLDVTLDLMRCDEALARRAEPLVFGSLKDAEAAPLAKAIREKAREAGLQFDPARETIARLMHAANSQLGLALEMSWQAIARAKERSVGPNEGARLLIDDFADVYHRRTACGMGLNVFDVADWRRIDTSETVPRIPDEAPPAKRRRKRMAT